MWTRKLLKDNAKVAFKRNYWLCVVVSLIAMLLGASTSGRKIEFDYENDTIGYNQNFGDIYIDDYDNVYSDEYIYDADVDDILDIIVGVVASPIFIVITIIIVIVVILSSILVSNVVNVGHKRYYLENREHKTPISKLFYSFGNGRYAHTVWIMFCKELYIFGWTLLFIIPGIIKGFSYMMIPYILAENPEISHDRAFEISKEMMNGHKWDAFVLELSFIGWRILTTITFGIVGIFWTGPYMDATYAEFYTALKAEAFQKGITNSMELPGVAYPEFTNEFSQQV